MIKFFNTVCLTVLCLHNQLFASEAIRALSSFNAQLQELTIIRARNEITPEPRVMSAEETLAYMQSGGDIKLSAEQLQEIKEQNAQKKEESDWAREAIAKREAKKGKKGLSPKKTKREEQVLVATGLIPELTDIIRQYDVPVFRGERERCFSAFNMRDPYIRDNFRESETHPITKLLATSGQQIALSVPCRDLPGYFVLITFDGERPVYRMIQSEEDRSFITTLGLMPTGELLYARFSAIYMLDLKSLVQTRLKGWSGIWPDSHMVTVQDGVVYNSETGLSLISKTNQGALERKKLPFSSKEIVRSLVALSDGRLVFCGGAPVELNIVDRVTGRVSRLASGRFTTLVELVPGSLLSVEVEEPVGGIIKIWDVTEQGLQQQAQQPVRTFVTPEYITALVVLPDERIVHNGGKKHYATILDPKTGGTRLLEEGVEGRSTSALAVMDFEGDVRLVVGYSNGQVAIWR